MNRNGKSRDAWRESVRLVFLCALLFFSAVGCAQQNEIAARPEGLARPVTEFRPQQPLRWELPNGLVVYYQQDRSLPLMRGTLYLRGGGIFDPAEIPGLASGVGSLLRDGGVEGISPDELDRKLDLLAASIDSQYDDENGTVSFSSLAEDFTEVFSLFSRVVRTPAFDEGRLQLWKALTRDSIARRRDDPRTMGLMAFQDLLYGVGSPYSHFVSEQSLKKILQRELRLFARRFVRPNGAILAVSGSLSMEEFQKVVNQELGGWERRAEPLPIIPPSTHVPKPGVYVLERDFDQATILLGQPGPPRLTADRYDIAVFNRYFSFSGFGSVLFGEIRSRLGLAYSIDGGFFPRAQAGDFRVMLATRVTEAERATREVLRLIEQCRKERPASGRLEEIKLAATNSFIFNFVKPGQIANRAALLELFGFPKDADQVYVERISQVAPEGVQSVAERRIAPEQMVVVIVGRVKPELLTLPNVYRLGFDTEPRVLGKVSRLRGDWDK